MFDQLDKTYWTDRYNNNQTGWDLKEPSIPLKKYIDQLENTEIKILIPGAGNAYEAEYLFDKGFKNVDVLDFSNVPLNNIKNRLPYFPSEKLIEKDFFKHSGQYDLIVEQTFFCSFEPHEQSRHAYSNKMASLLKPKGKLVGVWFNIPLIEGNFDSRPFGGTKNEYLTYLKPFFDIKTFENCYNSIEPRKNQELFGIFIKKN